MEEEEEEEVVVVVEENDDDCVLAAAPTPPPPPTVTPPSVMRSGVVVLGAAKFPLGAAKRNEQSRDVAGRKNAAPVVAAVAAASFQSPEIAARIE